MNLSGSIRINKCGMLILLILFLTTSYYLLFSGSSAQAKNHDFGSKNLNEINLRKLLIGSIQAAILGGVEVEAISRQADFSVKSKGKTKEGANDPVTDADFRSHCVMRLGLKRIFPKLNIVSEEDVGEGEKKCPEVKLFDLDPTVLHETSQISDDWVSVEDVTVWIDPLDATQEYTERLFKYVTTMVCVAVKGEPIIGVIHNPFSRKTTWAWLDHLTSEDIQAIKRTDNSEIRNPILTVSRSHAGDVQEISKKIFGESVHVLPAAGAGYKVLSVISGNATAYIHTTAIKKWDLCAGNAILNSLKGKMTNLDNEIISYEKDDPVVADKGLLAALNNHQQLIEKIGEFKHLFAKGH